MKIEVISNISEINEKQWNNINANDYPFTSHEFLYSLEESKSVSIETGWQPKHIIVKNKVRRGGCSWAPMGQGSVRKKIRLYKRK